MTMSGFSQIPTHFIGGDGIDNVFKSAAEKESYDRIINGKGRPELVVKRVKVEIFDLSDAKQVRKYEKLWKTLLDKASRMEVVVDTHKDLVRRPDGTSYWMKYVEYVEFE